MTEAIIGLICGTAAIALFASGFAAGWVLRGKSRQNPAPCLTDEQKRELEQKKRAFAEQQRAFQLIQNYDAAAAYGIHTEADNE